MVFGIGMNFGQPPGINLVAVSSPASLEMWINSDFVAAVELELPESWSELYWTVKDGYELDKASDDGALLQIKLTNGGDAGDGLQILNRDTAEDSSLARLIVNDDRTEVTIIVAAAAIAVAGWIKKLATHDFAVHTSSGAKPLLVPPGSISLNTNVTRTLPAS